MPVSYLELENFKSYAGVQRIGPFKDLTCVIGPNGSGKSNLMDAISFLLGVQSRDLRSSQLKDLIFRPPDQPAHSKVSDDDDDDDDDESSSTAERPQLRARATLVYEHPEDADLETRFSRTISAKGVGEYRVNNRAVSFAEYEKELGKIGVLLAARNFLVFQGDVEQLATKTPRQITQLLEQVSGSDELQEPFDASCKAHDEAEAQRKFLCDKVTALKAEAKALRIHTDEARKFQKLLEQKTTVTTDFYLWQLYHIEMDVSEKQDLKRTLLMDAAELAETEAIKAEELGHQKKNANAARKATALADKLRVAAAADVDKLQPSRIRVTEELKSLQRQVAADMEALERAQHEETLHDKVLIDLTNDIQDYTETEQQLSREYEQKKQEALASKVILSEEQEAEYERIKDAAAVASSKQKQICAIAVQKLECARVRALNLSDEVKEAQASKEKAAKSAHDYTERKNKLETVSSSSSMSMHFVQTSFFSPLHIGSHI